MPSERVVPDGFLYATDNGIVMSSMHAKAKMTGISLLGGEVKLSRVAHSLVSMTCKGMDQPSRRGS